MTLILTALCKDGICIGSDLGREVKETSTSQPRMENGEHKVFGFANIPLLICHHGIDELNSKRWDERCAEYEQSLRWEGLKFKDCVEDFKEFIETHVEAELRNNDKHDGVGFMLCGALKKRVTFSARELFWKKGCVVDMNRRTGLILSGDGQKYVAHNKRKDERFWSNITVERGQKEIDQLFREAIELQRKGKQEFSEKYEFKTLMWE